MSNVIVLKRSDVAGAVPQPGHLVAGELAVNTRDGRLFAKKIVPGQPDTLVEFITNSGTWDIDITGSASALGDIPVILTGVGESDTLQFKNNAWRNSPQSDITDGGNF